MSLRAYQSWERGGGIAWPNLEQLARVHSVDAAWLAHGVSPAAHDRELEDLRQRLLEIERTVARTHEQLAAQIAALTAELGSDRTLARRVELLEARLHALTEIALEEQLERAAASGSSGLQTPRQAD